MPKSPFHHLSKRERQIMDHIHELGEASVGEILDRVPDAPSYNSIRVTLSILEKKGHVTHRRDGKKYIYKATARKDRTRSSALQHVVKTFFGNSVPAAVSTLLGLKSSQLSDEDLAALEQLIDEERRRRRRK